MSTFADSQVESSESEWKDAPTPRANPWASSAKTKDLKAAFLRRGPPASQASTDAVGTVVTSGPPPIPARVVSSTFEAGDTTQSTKSLTFASPTLGVQPDAGRSTKLADLTAPNASEGEVSAAYRVEAKSTWEESPIAEANHATQPGSAIFDHRIKTETPQVWVRKMIDDAGPPRTVMTAVSDIIGAATEQEIKRQPFDEAMPEAVEARNEGAQRDSLQKKRRRGEHRLKETSDHRGESEPSFSQNKLHSPTISSALPLQKRGEARHGVRRRMRRMFSKSRPRVDEKPLPPVPDSGDPYDPDSTAYIPGAYIPSPATPLDNVSSCVPMATCEPVAYRQQDRKLDPRAATFGPAVGFRLPDPGVVVTASDSLATGRILTDTTGNLADPTTSFLVTHRNPNEGIILSHDYFTAPTRYQGFATRQQTKIAHPPSQHSFAASIVDPHSPADQRLWSRASVVPEPKGERAEQYAAAERVENIYNRESADSVSSTDFTDPAELDGMEPETRPGLPRLGRSSSLPAIAVHPFTLRDKTANVAPANRNGFLTPCDTTRAALKSVSGGFGATSATSAPAVTVSAVVGLVHTRLDYLHNQVSAMEARLVAVQQTVQAEMIRRMDGLEAQMNRIFTLMGRQGAGGDGHSARWASGRRGGAMQARLGAMPPHIPYGGQQNGW